MSNLMKLMKLFAAALAITTVAACASTHKKEQAKNQPPTPAQVQANQQAADRTAYVAQTQARIDQLTKFSQDLRNRAATAPKPQDKKLQNAAEDMDSLLNDARRSIGEINAAAPDSWLLYKRDVEKSMDRAESEYTNTASLVR